MSKVAVVYWSGTGNTEAMANAVADGAKASGAEVELFKPADFNAEKMAAFDGIAFGCPSMGDEVLEEDEFEPMFNKLTASLGGKRIALFGSYGWETVNGCATGIPTAIPQEQLVFATA